MLKWIFIISFLGLCFQPSCGLWSQFLLFQTPKTWYEAQSFCRVRGCDLATISSMSEMKTVLEVVRDKYDTAVWIGLWRGTTPRWQWSLAGKEFYKDGENNYFKWGTIDETCNCASYTSGQLIMKSCENILYVVCFDGTKQGADQYILVTINLAWIDAREYCRTHYTDLTSLRNDAEYQMVQEVVSPYQVWVGLFRDSWEWSDQTNSSFRYWNATRSGISAINYCSGLVKTYSGRWGDLSCDDTYPFLCDCTEKTSRIIKHLGASEAVAKE